MAVLLEIHYDKAEILEAYLNEVFLGQQGAYAVHGFGLASQFYFDRPLERLEPQQIASADRPGTRRILLQSAPASLSAPSARRGQVIAALEETGLLTHRSQPALRPHSAPLGVTRSTARSPGVTRYHAFMSTSVDGKLVGPGVPVRKT